MNKKIKQTISAMAITAMLVPAASSFALQEIGDKELSDWAKPAVTALAEKDLIAPTLLAQKDYKGSITREEFAELMVVLYEYKNGTIASFQENIFNDTQNDYIEKASSIGVVAGFPGGLFKPKDKMTRQEMAVMLNNMLFNGAPGSDASLNKFSDKGNISSWAKGPVSNVVGNSLMAGDATGKFNPKDNLSRQEAISVVNNYVNKGQTPPVVTPPVTPPVDGGPILTGEAAQAAFRDLLKTYPANGLADNPNYINSFRVVENGTEFKLGNFVVSNVTYYEKMTPSGLWLMIKANVKSGKYDGGAISYYANNGTQGIWRNLETSDGEIAAKSIQSNQLKAVILFDTNGNSVLVKISN